MSSNITVKNGIYDPSKRFEFTNVTDQDFTFTWGGKPIVIKPKQKVILRHHLAVLATTKIVDQIMMDEINKKTAKARESNPNYLAPNQASSLGVPAARDPYEKMVLKELPPETSNEAELGIIRSEFQEQLLNDMSAKPASAIGKMSDIGISSIKEFEEVNIPKSN